ncbi:hypothetical protein SDC9_42422 [bioreactor metagenome]|uniref:Uncharacterized protein n=1 Tax=bioreactor metagenome TaxID=1076179 RepID=A0A644VY58_9ZZZZ
MANRNRNIQLKFWVSDDEKELIDGKMAILKTHNMGAYLRKMAIDGYIIQVDYTEQKKLASAVNKVGANFNQISKRINTTGHCYEEDIAEMKELMNRIWQLLKSSQSGEL